MINKEFLQKFISDQWQKGCKSVWVFAGFDLDVIDEQLKTNYFNRKVSRSGNRDDLAVYISPLHFYTLIANHLESCKTKNLIYQFCEAPLHYTWETISSDNGLCEYASI